MKSKIGLLLLAIVGSVSAVLGIVVDLFFLAGSVLAMMGALLLAELYNGR